VDKINPAGPRTWRQAGAVKPVQIMNPISSLTVGNHQAPVICEVGIYAVRWVNLPLSWDLPSCHQNARPGHIC
jgi:hypothetical protein